MTTFNRERNQGAEQGRPRRINTDDGQQTMEEVYDSQNRLIGYRPIANMPPQQSTSEFFPGYGVESLSQLPDDFYDRAQRGLEITRQQLQERAVEAQKARDLEAFRLATGMSNNAAPFFVQPPQAPIVHETVTAPPAPTKKHVELPTYPEGHDLRTDSNSDTVTKAKRNEKSRKRFNAKTVIALGVSGVVLAGGSVYAVSNLNGGSTSAAITNESNIPAIDPELIPDLTAAPLVEAFGGCMDENGGGSVLATGYAKSETTSTWMMGMKGPNGGELEAEFGKGEIIYPKVQLESQIGYTACVVAANVANVVSVDLTNPENPVAKVNLNLIDPQVRGSLDEDLTKIKRGWSSTDFVPKLAHVEELMKSGVDQGLIPTDVATSFAAAYNDAPNAGAEVLAAEKATVDTIATDGSAYSEQLKASIKQKIQTSIKEKVKQLAQDKLTTAKDISVDFGTSKLKPLLVKNQPAPKADRFTVAPKSIIKDFTVNAEQAK